VSVECGFRRIVWLLSICGFIFGTVALIAEWRPEEWGLLVGFLAVLTFGPWVIFYAVRWVAVGFRRN
jgi:hypothetical protein